MSVMSSARRSLNALRWRSIWRRYRLPETSFTSLAGDDRPLEPIYTDGLHMPPFAGPTNIDDVGMALSIIHQADPSVIVELGTGRGAFTANLCAVTNARIYTVNALPHQIQGNVTTFALARDEIGRIYRDNGYADRVVQVYDDTRNLQYSEILHEGDVVDVAIIDACHDAEFVLHDFLHLVPHTHDGSLILVHDVHPSMLGHLRESYLACMYLRMVGYNIYHIKDSWWGVWWRRNPCVKRTVSERLARGSDMAFWRLSTSRSIDHLGHLRYMSRKYHF